MRFLSLITNYKRISMIKEIKVVIGANYGDEGKGLVTSYLSQEAAKRNIIKKKKFF